MANAIPSGGSLELSWWKPKPKRQQWNFITRLMRISLVCGFGWALKPRERNVAIVFILEICDHAHTIQSAPRATKSGPNANVPRLSLPVTTFSPFLLPESHYNLAFLTAWDRASTMWVFSSFFFEWPLLNSDFLVNPFNWLPGQNEVGSSCSA